MTIKRLPLLLACALLAGSAYAETCLSPYIKQLKEPEKVMYLWTLPAGQGSDYLSVIDVNLASPTYGKLLKKIEVGSLGNEAHHMGYTDELDVIASLAALEMTLADLGFDVEPGRAVTAAQQVFLGAQAALGAP